MEPSYTIQTMSKIDKLVYVLKVLALTAFCFFVLRLAGSIGMNRLKGSPVDAVSRIGCLLEEAGLTSFMVAEVTCILMPFSFKYSFIKKTFFIAITIYIFFSLLRKNFY